MRLTDIGLAAITTDPDLYALAAKTLGVAPTSMPRILMNNDPRLTQYEILKGVAKHLKIEDINDLVTESSNETTLTK